MNTVVYRIMKLVLFRISVMLPSSELNTLKLRTSLSRVFSEYFGFSLSVPFHQCSNIREH